MPQEHRSPQAEQYRKLYRTKQWALVRARQLREHPFCSWCVKDGRRLEVATVCHHDDPKSKLEPKTFYAGPFTSLCARCHDSEASRIESRGYSKQVGPDGWPTDPLHPVNFPTTLRMACRPPTKFGWVKT